MCHWRERLVLCIQPYIACCGHSCQMKATGPSFPVCALDEKKMWNAERLAPLLRPRSIAVVGATQRPGAFGQRLLTNLATWGFSGDIYPINPGYSTLQDLPCYP